MKQECSIVQKACRRRTISGSDLGLYGQQGKLSPFSSELLGLFPGELRPSLSLEADKVKSANTEVNVPEVSYKG